MMREREAVREIQEHGCEDQREREVRAVRLSKRV
jgi:hypothetical protein